MTSSLLDLDYRYGSPAILGSFVALDRRGGSEDPWLCVADFGQLCLCQNKYDAQEKSVNSGMYLMSALGHYQTLRIHRNPSIEWLLSSANRSFRDRFVVLAKTVYLPLLFD